MADGGRDIGGGSGAGLVLASCGQLDGAPVVTPTTVVGAPTTTSMPYAPTTSPATSTTTSTPPPVVPDATATRTRMQVTEPADGAVIELVDVEVAHLEGVGQDRVLIVGGSFEMGCWQPALTMTPPVSGSATIVDLVGWLVERPDLFCTQAVVVWDVAVPAPGDGPVLVNGVPAT